MQSQRVLTYATVDQLFEEQSLFHEYSDVLHITATSTLRRGMTTYMSEGERLITAPILTFAQILNVVGCNISGKNLPDAWPWYSSKTQLRQFTLISQVLRELNKQTPTQNGKIYNALTKNKDVLLRTLRMFIEAGENAGGVKKKLGQTIGYEEEVAIAIWEKLEQDVTHEAFLEWKQQLNSSGLENINVMFAKIFKTFLENDEERQNANLLPKYSAAGQEEVSDSADELVSRYLRKKQIVLHGFYFITPIQQHIIDALQAADFKIIYLINYQHDYKSVFDVVDLFLGKDKTVFEPVSESSPFMNKIAQKFLQICEGDFQLDLSDMPNKYFEFNHMYQFKHYIQNEIQKEKEIHDFIISPRAKQLRSQVEDIGSMKKLTLKDYPIGQFLLHLHSLSVTTFDEEKKRFKDREELSVNLLMRIFSLGYIHVHDFSTRLLVKDLLKLRERLVGKFSFEEWKLEVQSIIEEKQLLEEALTPDNIDITENNESYIYKNRVLSYYDVTIENLHNILEALKAVEILYKDIFSSDSTIQISGYVGRMVEHLNEKIIPKIELEEEIDVARELLEVFEGMRNSDLENFDRQDLIQGLRFFLSEELDDNENSLFGESLIESKIVSLQDGDILPFLENQAVHLAFLDNKALPLSQNLVTWPFNDDSMKILYQKAPFTKGQYLHFIERRKQFDGTITKYLLYLIMLNASTVKFSIVRNLASEQDLKKSFYLDLLDLEKASEESWSEAGDSVEKKPSYKSVEITVNERKITPLIESTKRYCEKRMVLSYMLQVSPSFETNYHHRYLYEKFIAQLNYLVSKKKIQLSKADIRSLVSSWFPHWTETKKDILAMSGEKWNYRTNEFTVDGIRFIDDLRQLHLFGKNPKPSVEFANAGPHCKYCQFQDRCRESGFGKDE